MLLQRQKTVQAMFSLMLTKELFVEGIVTGDPFQPAQGSLSVASKGKVAAITATPSGGQS